MVVRSGTSAGTVEVQSVQVKSRPGRSFLPLIGASLLLLWDPLEGGAAFLVHTTSSFLTPHLLCSFHLQRPLPSFLLLYSTPKDRFLLNEKSTD